MAIISANTLHETLETALGRGADLLYKERKLLQERDYEGLASVIEQRIRDMKLMMWLMPLIGIGQVIAQGAIYIGRNFTEASAADVLFYAIMLLVTVALFYVIGMSMFVPRLLALERARFVVGMLLGDHEAEGAVAVNFK